MSLLLLLLLLLFLLSAEESSSAFVLFQAASTMQEAVLREWVVLPGEEKEALRAYILHYLTSRPS